MEELAIAAVAAVTAGGGRNNHKDSDVVQVPGTAIALLDLSFSRVGRESDCGCKIDTFLFIYVSIHIFIHRS